MASGKQLSFQHGEVSPSQRFKSGTVQYNTGLAKLRNMYVRRDGGVSNRPGLELMYDFMNVPQTLIPEEGGSPGIKGFSYWNPSANRWYTIEYALRDGEYSFLINGMDLLYGTPHAIVGPTPDKIRFTVLKDTIFVTPQLELSNGSSYNVAIPFDGSAILYDYGALKSVPFNAPGTSYGYTGKPPFLPVSYLLMAEMEDGTERYVLDFASDDIPNPDIAPAKAVVHPHASMVQKLNVSFTTAPEGVKLFKLYRAPGNGGMASASYTLAGQSRYDGTSTTLKFEDYGASTPFVTPPIDTKSVFLGALRGVEAAAYYQQRLLLGMKPGSGISGNGIPETFKAGDIMASKIGGVGQIIPPIISSDTGAFQFGIPTSDGTPCIAFLSMERAIAFTERGAFIIRGGDQGVLTPTSVNPLKISDEGCSKIVEPNSTGRRGYYINSALNKLMAVEFGVDGNVAIFDASQLSSHFLDQEVVQIETLGDGENSVFVLRRDGKLVQITAGEDGVHGFALLETSGYIESIYKSRHKKQYSPNAVALSDKEPFRDMLMCYVIREGVRVKERLYFREDKNRESEFFADSFLAFGQRLALNGSEGYARLVVGLDMVPIDDGVTINIEADGPWDAGETIKLRCSDDIPSGPSVSDFVMHFYHDEDGVEKTARFTFNSMVPVTDGTDKIYSGTFDVEVPESLRDVDAQTLSATEKARRKTRWLPAVKDIGGSNYVASIFSSGGGYTGTPQVPVSVVGDGYVLSSPLNPNKDTLYIERNPDTLDLELILPDYFAWGYIGLPYTSEMETLDIEVGDNRTLTDSKKIINAVGVGFMETRGGFFGMPDRPLEEMEELITRDDGNMYAQTKNKNGYQTITIPSEWTEAGRVNIKNVDPIPMTILSVYPKGIAGD